MPNLIKKLMELNSFFDEKVRSQIQNIYTDEKYKYNGIIIPFNEGDDRDPSIIMNIIPELA